MTKVLSTDLCIIGAGSGGLSIASVAPQMGVDTILVERHLMGGGRLNYGCVPSKALLSIGRLAKNARGFSKFGIQEGLLKTNVSRAFAQVQKALSSLEPDYSIERFEGLGVKILKGTAKFKSANIISVGALEIRSKKFVISTGSRPIIPAIKGLKLVPYLTNETIFREGFFPEHLIIIGGGVSGIEISQAFCNLGAQVSIVEIGQLLASEDKEIVDVIRKKHTDLGINIFENTIIQQVENSSKGIKVYIKREEELRVLSCTHLMVCVGKKPNLDELDLGAAGIKRLDTGIEVDRRLRTSNKKVFAIGDVLGGPMFSHLAAYQAEVVMKNILFSIPAKIKYKALPRVIFSNPEVAQVGLIEREAKEKFKNIRILRWPYFENDRAHIEDSTDGFIKVITLPSGKILGAGVVGKSAGELIQTWVLALDQNLKIGAIAKLIFPYPTFGEISKRVAGSFFIPNLMGQSTKMLIRIISKIKFWEN